MRSGRVSRFDDAAGLGSITADDGTEYAFQCISIADGTRTIDVGRRVLFRELSRFGAVEAGEITPV